jgi:hippurate hydrolase
MHACGHDGHTAALLSAARHLAREGRFNGTLNLIFQPAEEGQGGARRMLEDGLLEKFPCDAVLAFHNHPGSPVGTFGTLPGRFASSSDTVLIDLKGRGGHGSMPHLCVDAAVAAAHVVVALQTVVARNVDPREMAVVSVGVLQAGTVANAIADSAHLELTVRAFDAEVRALLRDRITSLVRQQAQTLGAEAAIEYRWRYPVMENDPDMTSFVRGVVGDWLGQAGFAPDVKPPTGSEDFAFLLERCPGCYVDIGTGDGPDQVGLHHPRFDFNDAILPVAASYWVRLTEAFLA